MPCRKPPGCWPAAVQQVGDRAHQIAEEVPISGLGSDVQVDLVQIHHQPEQIEMQRSEYEIEDLTARGRRCLRRRCRKRSASESGRLQSRDLDRDQRDHVRHLLGGAARSRRRPGDGGDRLQRAGVVDEPEDVHRAAEGSAISGGARHGDAGERVLVAGCPGDCGRQ